MKDIFDNTILCNKCNSKMQKARISKEGFILRVIVCPKCGEKALHPADKQEFDRFTNLKNKEFRVKMRLVGNSYAVSIPKEIVSFIREQEKTFDDMVRLCFEEMGRVSLNFDRQDSKPATRVIKSREYRVVKDNKPVLHFKQFSDSDNPKNNKTFLIKKTDKEKR